MRIVLYFFIQSITAERSDELPNRYTEKNESLGIYIITIFIHVMQYNGLFLQSDLSKLLIKISLAKRFDNNIELSFFVDDVTIIS